MSSPDPLASLRSDMAKAVLHDAARTADGISDLLVNFYLTDIRNTNPAVAIHVGFAFAAKLLLLCTKPGRATTAFDGSMPALRRWIEIEDVKRLKDGP